MKLTPRDRRCLIALGVFLAGAALYVAYLNPLQAKVRRCAATVRARRTELWKQENKLRELHLWREDSEKLHRQLSGCLAGARMPALGAPIAEILKAIGEAAAAAQVDVRNLRPVPKLLADSNTPVIDSFSIEGYTSAAAFDRLLWELRGMAVAEATLARGETDAGPLRFHVQAQLLPAETLTRLAALAPPAEEPARFTPADNPFQPRLPPVSPAPAPAAGPVAPPPPPPPAESDAKPAAAATLAGAALRGVAEIAGQRVAVLADSATGTDRYVLCGEAYGEWVLQGIDAQGVTLLAKNGGPAVRLELPPRSEPHLEPDAAAAGAPGAAKEHAAPARLGLTLRQLTTEEAAAGAGSDSTLLVTAVERPDEPVRVGDLLCEINGVRVASIGDVKALLGALRHGADVTVGVQRQRDRLTLTLPLR